MMHTAPPMKLPFIENSPNQPKDKHQGKFHRLASGMPLLAGLLFCFAGTLHAQTVVSGDMDFNEEDGTCSFTNMIDNSTGQTIYHGAGTGMTMLVLPPSPNSPPIPGATTYTSYTNFGPLFACYWSFPDAARATDILNWVTDQYYTSIALSPDPDVNPAFRAFVSDFILSYQDDASYALSSPSYGFAVPDDEVYLNLRGSVQQALLNGDIANGYRSTQYDVYAFVSNDYTANMLFFSSALPVPEPSGFCLTLAGAGLMIGRRNRKTVAA